MPETRIETDRLILRSWRRDDLDDFARLHADDRAMRDYKTTLSAADSRQKLDDYRVQYERHGFIRWRVSTKADEFLGYAGIYPNGPDHPLGAHGDIGWRFLPRFWGQGYATEAARSALAHGFGHCGLTEVLAYTQSDNSSSQAVIARLPFRRDPTRDFTISDQHVENWHGLVWAACPDSSSSAE